MGHKQRGEKFRKGDNGQVSANPYMKVAAAEAELES